MASQTLQLLQNTETRAAKLSGMRRTRHVYIGTSFDQMHGLGEIAKETGVY
jgi:hypothetical protein